MDNPHFSYATTITVRPNSVPLLIARLHRYRVGYTDTY
jgi:hypothetical protein